MLAVASAACGLLSESRTSGNHISSSQYSSVATTAPTSAAIINDTAQETTTVMTLLVEHEHMITPAVGK